LDFDKRLIEKQARRTELGHAYDGLRDLGIDALPFAFERIKSGDSDLLPLVRDLTDGAADSGVGALEDRALNSLNWWASHAKKWTLPPVSAAKLKEEKR
jgi:hypothetical protein